tara:strand:+ start:279 stop:1307 length:1029 start_codon:yes stop_codon:yes gene_type:complete
MPEFTLQYIAEALDAAIEGNSELVCTGVASLDEAVEGDATFMVNDKYAKLWAKSNATIGIIPVGVSVKDYDNSQRALLRVKDADLAIATLLDFFMPQIELPNAGIHSTATISDSAIIGKGVSIGPGVVISDEVRIGDGAILCSSVHVGRGSTVGERTVLRTNVVIEHDCQIGDDCILNAHVVIGADGFGYRPNESGDGLTKMPHIGNVIIGNQVELGANTCIDRGKFAATIIGDGTKVDNLVQVGHNVKVGKNCVIAAHCGIAGSVQIGNWVQIGAQVGIAPHCKVGDGTKIGAKSGVMHDIPDGEEWLGVPAGKMKDTLRQWAIVRKMPELAKQLSPSKQR